MSCNCHNYTPCDPVCPQCSGTTTSSTTTTTTTCSSDIVCTDYWKDICVEHSGDSCYQIPAGTNLNSILMHLLSFVPPTPGCTTTSTTTIAPTTTTTTLVPTTTTTTCICPTTTTTTQLVTTTTTTLAPCDCETYSLKNVSNVTQTYSYTNCSRARFIDIPLAAGATVLICVCDEDLTYNNNFILALGIGAGCNTSTTTSTSTTSTTSTSSTTTTTTAAPVCNEYRVQSNALPASWSAQTCYGVPVGGSFSAIGQSIYTGCILSTTLVINNASIKEVFPCPPTTTTSTSTTSTTSTTTAAPTTTTTTKACLQYAIYSETGGYATAKLCDTGLTTYIGVGPGQTVLTPCVLVGSVITNEASIIYSVPCGSTTTSTTTIPPSTTSTTQPTTTTSSSTTSTSSTSTSTTTSTTSTSTTTTGEPTTTTTTVSPQSNWTVRNADCSGGTINGVSINGSSIPSLTGNDFPLTSTQSGTASNPSGINYGGSNTIQANVTTNIAGSGNCAVMYIFINDLFNPAHTLFFTSNPFPQISGVVINGGDVVEVQIACLTGPCPETTTTTIEPTTTSTTSTTSTSTTSTTLEPTTTTSTSTSTSTTTTTTVEPTTTTSTSTTTTVEPPPTTTTTTVEETYTYYNVTQFLNCVQNSAPGGFVMRVPTALDTGATWWCGDDGFQYQFDSNTSGPSYNITAVDVAISCGSLSC